MQYLRQSTEVDVRVGPFVDVSDGFTPQTDITLAGNEAELLKHDGAATVDISARTWAAVSSCRGWYDLTLTTADTGTLGQLTVVVQDDSDCLPVFRDFMVVPSNVWDSMFSTDKLQVDLTQIDGSATSGNNATLNLAQLNITNSAGTAVVAKSTGGNGYGMDIAGNGTGEAVLATGGTTANGIQAVGGATSGAGIYAAASANNDAGMQLVANGTGKDLDADETDDILADTNEIQGKLPTNNIMGSSVLTDKDDEIDAIKAVTDLLPNAGALTDIDTGVNNIEAKLPTNYIMGSSDQADHDGEIGEILTDTADIQPKLGTPVALDAGSADISSMLTKLADDNGGASYDATSDSQTAIAANAAGDWTTAEKNQIRFRLAMDGTQADPVTGTGTIEDILADTNEVQGKLPTNNIMGSSVLTDKDDEIDAIKAVTDLLPNAGALTDIDTGVNNIEAKLPTNYIMGSSDQADHDGEIGDILTDTADMQPKIGTPVSLDTGAATLGGMLTKMADDNGGASFDATSDSQNAIAASAAGDWTTAEKNQIRFRLAMDGTQADPTTGTGTIEDILADTNEVQGKLPTNNIMGSSVLTDKDDEIDAIKAVTDLLPNAGALTDIDTGVNNIEAKLPTNYIMGSSDQAAYDGEIGDILSDTNELQGLIAAGKINAQVKGMDTDTLTAAALAADAGAELADAIADEEYDNDGTAISLRGAVKLFLSVLTGKSSGGGTTTLVFRDIADAKNRISVTVDANGNRTAVGTRDAT